MVLNLLIIVSSYLGNSSEYFLLGKPDCLFSVERQNFLQHTHTHSRLTALFPGLPRWAGTRKVKPIWILLKQQTESGSGISWAICKSEPCSRQTTTPAPHYSVFYRLDALPAAQPTASKHWRQILQIHEKNNTVLISDLFFKSHTVNNNTGGMTNTTSGRMSGSRVSVVNSSKIGQPGFDLPWRRPL